MKPSCKCDCVRLKRKLLRVRGRGGFGEREAGFKFLWV